MSDVHIDTSGSITPKSSLNLSVRSNLSAMHALTAARFARTAGEIERANLGRPFGDFYESIVSYVTGSVLSSVAALEASINEVFADRISLIPEQSDALTAVVWEIVESKASILDKYDIALLLKDKPRMDKGLEPYQNAAALIALRNALVHFKPEWDHEGGNHRKLAAKLEHKFPLSPFLGVGNSIFPKRCMSHGCAAWSVNTSAEFMTAFCVAAGLPDRFAPFATRLATS